MRSRRQAIHGQEAINEREPAVNEHFEFIIPGALRVNAVSASTAQWDRF